MAAEPCLIEAYAIFMKTRGQTHADTRATVQILADLYLAWEKAQPGNGHDAKAAEWSRKGGGREDARTKCSDQREEVNPTGRSC